MSALIKSCDSHFMGRPNCGRANLANMMVQKSDRTNLGKMRRRF